MPTTDPIRVLSSRFGQRYENALYEPMVGSVERLRFPPSFPDDDCDLRSLLPSVDIFHLHWPELMLPPDLMLHLRLIERLEDAGVKIVWTQHNLLPHVSHPDWPAIYASWADAADGVIHHSEWGMARALEFREFRPDAVHRVIRHGHWGALRQPLPQWNRTLLAEQYHLDPQRTHLGVLGGPRPSKNIGQVVKGFKQSNRIDLDLAIFSLGAGDPPPRHRRIRARRYRHVSREIYNFRLAMIDVLVLPFDDDGSMLTTGLIGDAIGTAKPVIASDWPFLRETFEDAALYYGSDAAGLARTLANLDVTALPERSAAMRALQAKHSWENSAQQTLEFFRDLIASSAFRNGAETPLTT